MENFDVFIGIDWSGAKAPVKNNSIAFAVYVKKTKELSFSKTALSRTDIYEWIIELAYKRIRTFIGIDCNFGYARSVGIEQFGKNYTYIDQWETIDTVCNTDNNFFAANFWGNKKYKDYFWTSGKMLEGFAMPQRLTEKICTEKGLGHPESPFKLIGAKQVGKGGLSGMRMAYHLKQKLGDIICFWPFEDHTDNAILTVSEIYPRQFIKRAGLGLKKLDLDTLNAALDFFDTPIIHSTKNISNHQSDAIVSAAGLAHICGDNALVPAEFSKPVELSAIYAKTEGWIFGV